MRATMAPIWALSARPLPVIDLTDGVIDPRDTREVLAQVLSICRDAELRQSDRRPRTPEPSRPEDLLSARELEILRLVAQGLSNKEIGSRLSITEGTVKNRLSAIYRKLGVSSRREAVHATV